MQLSTLGLQPSNSPWMLVIGKIATMNQQCDIYLGVWRWEIPYNCSSNVGNDEMMVNHEILFLECHAFSPVNSEILWWGIWMIWTNACGGLKNKWERHISQMQKAADMLREPLAVEVGWFKETHKYTRFILAMMICVRFPVYPRFVWIADQHFNCQVWPID